MMFGFHPSSLVKKETPFVNLEQWPQLCADGWRWLMNYTHSEIEKARRTIADQQLVFGDQNVAVGHPFKKNVGPQIHAAEFAIYVRDGELLIAALQEELDKFVGMPS
jgi:hypothetical protein